MRISLLLLAAAILHSAQVTLDYMGTAGWRITSGQTIILIDPYLTRAKGSVANRDCGGLTACVLDGSYAAMPKIA
jgi:L-ascorbate metabolism protein UlaG (beta-lactamase superfamily)